MDLSRQKSAGFNFRHLVLGVVVWWILMALGYTITVLRIERIKNGIRNSGISAVKELAKHIRVELLENDAQAIRRQLIDTGKREDIVYLAVSDYRNEIVAVAGTEKVKPVRHGSVQKKEQITFWEGEFPNHKKTVSYTSDIYFAGTKIGEIYLALSAVKAEMIRNQFIIVAVLSFLFLLLLIVVLGLRKINVSPWPLKDFFWRRRRVAPNLEKYIVACPLCGTKKPVNSDLFNHSNPYEKSIAKISNPVHNAVSQADLKGIDLTEIAKHEDLYWIKRQVILRCAEIIQKLTA